MGSQVKITLGVIVALALAVTTAAVVSIASGYNADAAWGALGVVAASAAFIVWAFWHRSQRDIGEG